MYLYIYDEFVQDKKYARELASIENRLTDLGIQGKIIRLALFRQAGEQIRDEAARGASTVVVVGNDRTLAKVLDGVADAGLPLGIIPIGPLNNFAKILGVPSGVQSCDMLSARIIEKIDLGVINGKRFIAGVRIPGNGVVFTCEGKYRIETAPNGQIEVHNLTVLERNPILQVSNPKDGFLELVAEVPTKRGILNRSCVGCTRLPFTFGTIDTNAPIQILCDGEVMQGNSFSIEIQPNSIKLITGRARLF